MPSLLDIAAPEITAEEVDIRGTKLTVRGLKAQETAALLKRFPIMAKQAAKLEVDKGDALVNNLEATPAIIAAGLGKLGDAGTEALVEERLTTEEKILVLAVVTRLTGEEAGPLARAAAAEAEPPGREPGSSSAPPSTS
jgi:hypothetical protein